MKTKKSTTKTPRHPFLILALCLCAFVVQSQAQTVQKDLGALYADTLGSTNSTYVVFGERKLTGDADKVGALWFFNANDNIAVGGGVAREWTPNRSAAPASFNLSAGIQLSISIAPLNAFGITNKFARPFVGTFVGTPFSGQNSGNLMNATRTGADIRIYQFDLKKNPLIISGGGYYGNESGTGIYAGNWAGGYLRISWGAFSEPQLSDNRNANAWATVAFNER